MPQLTPFQQAALEYKKHVSLTANAGSGKTFVLANRFVEIALRENLSLNKIVAITFTEKAAGELNRKIADEIDNRIIEIKDGEQLKILRRMRRQLTSTNISTIHSFCINLLKEFSPEAGIDANFTPLNQQDADELLSLSIDDFVSRNLAASKSTEALKSLIRLLGGKNKFVTEISSLVGSRKVITKLKEKVYSKEDKDIHQYFEKLENEYLGKILAYEIDPLINSILSFNDTVLNYDNTNLIAQQIKSKADEYFITNIARERLKSFADLREIMFTKGLTIKKTGYTKKDYELDENLRLEIESRIDELKSLLNLNFDEQNLLTLINYGRQVVDVTSSILTEYNERKRKNGNLDFEDILIQTKELTSQKEFGELLKDKYEYIMIDEYQDTNEIQYEIFMPILKNLETGNLFVVGDEKQSIYMFREAELEVFNRTKDDIVKRNEEGNLILPHSFRVAPAIAHFTNELFKEILKNPNLIYNDVEYSELICSRPKNDGGKVELLINTNLEKTEAELVASRIMEDQIEEEKRNWSDYAVLCRRRNDFQELEKCFSDLEIPFVIAGGKGFYQRQTIYDIYNYISFLLNPDDDASMIGLLRSPFYAVDDETIYGISLQNGNSFFEKFIRFSDEKNGLVEAVEKLREHLSLASSIRLSALLRELFKSCNYWGVTSAKQNHEQELSNLFKILGVARKFSLQSFKTLYDFKLFLNEAIGTLEDEGQAQIADSSNAVKIMTYHQAKGLEFKNVFLYKCNGKQKDESVKAKSLEIDKKWGVITKVPVNNNYFENYESHAIADIYGFIQTKKQIAESKRLFYVGVTRAIDNLFLTATILDNKISKNSFIDFTFKGLKTTVEVDSIKLNSTLKFMSDAENDFKISEESLETEIAVRKDNFENALKKVSKEYIPTTYEKVQTGKINDNEKNEIVSATKIAIFTQCPTKYYLTYELGYTELFKMTKSFSNEYDFKQGEDENLNIFADIRGQIIHKVLEEEISENELEQKVDSLIDFHLHRIGEKKELFTEKIIADLTQFYGSDIYKKLKEKTNFKNEFEVYSKETDYYVYGIIDKLIIDEDKLTIVDYKTDNVKEDKIFEKAEHYLPQLKFYAYTLNRFYKSIKQIDVQLIFIKHPEKVVQYSFKNEEIWLFGNEIKSIVQKIREQNFTKNLNHCAKCHFSIDKKCVFQT